MFYENNLSMVKGTDIALVYCCCYLEGAVLALIDVIFSPWITHSSNIQIVLLTKSDVLTCRSFIKCDVPALSLFFLDTTWNSYITACCCLSTVTWYRWYGFIWHSPGKGTRSLFRENGMFFSGGNAATSIHYENILRPAAHAEGYWD